MKYRFYKYLVLLMSCLAMPSLLWAQTSITAPQLFTNKKPPHIDWVLDNSGSMGSDDHVGTYYPYRTVCACYTGSGGTPAQYDCDANGSPATRNDALVGILRGFLDKNNSGTCLGHFNSIDAFDITGFEYGFVHYQAAPTPTPTPTPGDVNVTTTLNSGSYPGWPPPVNNYCAGGNTTIRYQFRRTVNDAIDLDPFINTMRPNGLTPIASTFHFLYNDPNALLALSNPSNPAYDPAFACRDRSVVLISDGDDTCAGPNVAQITTNLAYSAYGLHTFQRTIGGLTSPLIKGFAVGFQAGLNGQGETMLNIAAAHMGSDSDGDGDHNANTFCWPDPAGSKRIDISACTKPVSFGTSGTPTKPACATLTNGVAACSGCTSWGGTGQTCPGNAFFVNDPTQLINTLNLIAGSLQQGSYSVSPPQLAFSGDGTSGLLLSYFTVNQASVLGGGLVVPAWTGHLEHVSKDPTTGLFSIYKYKTFDAIFAQGTASRKHYTLATTGTKVNQLVPFTGAELGNSMTLSEFFPLPSPSPSTNINAKYDFNDDGIGNAQAPNPNPDNNDALDIINWIVGVENSASPTAPGGKLSWKTSPTTLYRFQDWPTGSIFNGIIKLVGAPNDPFNLDQPAYISYVTQQALRHRIALMPTNGGTISAINDPAHDDPSPLPTPGKELWAYVPKSIRSKLYNLRYQTTYYNDGYSTEEDILKPVNPTGSPAPSANDWQTRAYIGLGNGGNAVVSLNVTNTDTFDSCIGSSNCTANDHWEFSDPDLGLTTGRHRIVRVRDTANRLGLGANVIVPLLVIPGGKMDATQTAAGNNDNSRYIYFLRADTGDLFTSISGKTGKKEIVALSSTLVGQQMQPMSPTGVPAAMETMAMVDVDNDGLTDYIFLGTDAGDVYRVNLLGDLEKAIDPTNKGVPIWQARDIRTTYNLFANASDPAINNGVVNCSNASVSTACEAKFSGRDRRVAHIIPYWHQGTNACAPAASCGNNLRLVVFFEDPYGLDQNNKPDTVHPRGAIIRVLDKPLDTFSASNQFHENEIADSSSQYYGPTKLPREFYYDSTNQTSDRGVDLTSAFVIDHKLFYLLFRPSSSACSGIGQTYLAGIDLLTGDDVFVTPNPSAPLPPPDNSNSSTENYFQITADGVATMKVNFLTGVITFGSTTGSPPVVNLSDNDFSATIKFPTKGASGWVQSTAMF